PSPRQDAAGGPACADSANPGDDSPRCRSGPCGAPPNAYSRGTKLLDPVMNDTFAKFGWPETRIAETEHWGVMLRPEQPVLGALVLGCKLPVRSFGAVGEAGMADLASASAG